MRIEHIALYTNKLEEMRDFFIKYFHAASNSGYHNTTTDFRSYFLTFDNGCRLEIMTKPDIAVNETLSPQTGYVHIAFNAGSQENVDTLTEQLKQDGYAVVSGPRVTGDGYYESCIAGPENLLVEITI